MRNRWPFRSESCWRRRRDSACDSCGTRLSRRASARRLDLIATHTVQRKGLVVALILLGRSACLAQSNDVYSFFTSASTPLTGYRVSVVSTSPIWVVGSAQNGFGIEECSYWTDSAGGAIPWPATRVRQPGDKQHRYTRFRLGQVSISMRLRPIDVAFLAGFVALASGCLLIARYTRRRTQTDDEPIKV